MTSFETLNDATLIEKTLAGDRECFDVLVRRHMPAVRKRVRSMLWNRADEDDVVQETFVKAWRHLQGFRSDCTFRTWVLRVATNEVLQKIRRDQSHPAASDAVLETFASPAASPHEQLVRREARRRVRTAIASLPVKYQQILILRELDDFTTKEVAGFLKSGIPMVKSRLLRARQKLHTALLQAA